MSEQAGEQGIIDQEALEAGFKLLTVKPIHFDGWFWGPGRISSFTPTRQAWAEGRPQKLGLDIRQILGSSQAVPRFYSLSGEVIERRKQYPGRFSGKVYTQPIEGGTISHAGIIGITDVDVGRGRILPLLRLEEYNNPPPQREFALSLSDMAHYVQTHQVKLTLT